MLIRDLLTFVITGLWRKKFRTSLTILGVIVGTSAIVIMVSLGVGMQRNVMGMLEDMGSITDLVVTPEYDFDEISLSDDFPDPIVPLTDKVVSELKKLEGIVSVVPLLELYNAEINMGRYSTRASVIGIEPNDVSMSDYKVLEGRFLAHNNENGVVIGYKIPELMKPGNKQKNKKQKTNLSLSDTDLEESREEKQRLDLLNKSIVLNLTKMGSDGQEISKTVRLRVVGILEEEGGQEDQNLYISLKLAEQLVKWKEGDQVLKKKGYDSVKVKVKSVELVEEVQKEIEKLNLNSFSLKQMLATVNNISRVIQFILGGIGSIALIVASFGIMNTMMMSIYERTREIGIMKVIGASINNIRTIFLIEAGIIGLVGGVVGLMIGWISAQFLNVLANLLLKSEESMIIVDVPWWLGLFVILFSTAVGVLSGLYPALRAAKLSALDAIRHN